jgi:hypothetical protein
MKIAKRQQKMCPNGLIRWNLFQMPYLEKIYATVARLVLVMHVNNLTVNLLFRFSRNS